MIYSKRVELKKYLFKNKKSFIIFLQLFNSYINDAETQYEIELVNDEYSVSLDNFNTLIGAIDTSNIIYYLSASFILDKSQTFNKIEFVYHNMDNFKNKTNIKLHSKDINWIQTTEQEILESLEDKKYFLRFLDNEFISSLIIILLSTLYLIKNPNIIINFNNISDLLSFFILFGTVFFMYMIIVTLLTPTFKIKWNLKLNPIIKYLYDKIIDNIIGFITGAILSGIFSLVIAKFFL